MTSFSVGIPRYKPEVLEAMEEAKRTSGDPNTKRYRSFAEVLEDIDPKIPLNYTQVIR